MDYLNLKSLFMWSIFTIYFLYILGQFSDSDNQSAKRLISKIFFKYFSSFHCHLYVLRNKNVYLRKVQKHIFRTKTIFWKNNKVANNIYYFNWYTVAKNSNIYISPIPYWNVLKMCFQLSMYLPVLNYFFKVCCKINYLLQLLMYA